MGTLSEKIFQDDDAADVQAMYREKLIMGATDEEAEAAVLAEFEGFWESIWLPLALTQWKLGRLNERAKSEALKVIDDELPRVAELWKPHFVKKRIIELEKARAKLLSEMPARKKLRKPWWSEKSPFVVGDVLQYRIRYSREPLLHWNDRYALLLVVGIIEEPPDKLPMDMLAVRLFKYYSDKPISDFESIGIDELPTVDFIISAAAGTVSHMNISLIKQHMRESDMKRVGSIKRDENAVPFELVSRNIGFVHFYKIAETLEHYFGDGTLFPPGDTILPDGDGSLTKRDGSRPERDADAIRAELNEMLDRLIDAMGARQ